MRTAKKTKTSGDDGNDGREIDGHGWCGKSFEEWVW